MSPYSPYDRVLVFHGMGSGKSAVISAISEFAIQVAKGKISTNEIIILVRNPTLRRNIINDLVYKFSGGKYIPEEKDGEKLSQETITRRINQALGIHYRIETFTTFTNEIKLLTDDEIRRNYSNRYVLIDEAHNIRVRKVKTKKKDGTVDEVSASNYKEISRFIQNSLGSKIILLTATPARDKPSEIAQTLNLILPKEKQFDIKTFEQDYLNDNVIKSSMVLDFKDRIFGLVSYLRSDVSDIKIINAGSVDRSIGMIFLKTVRVNMDDFQYEVYKSAYNVDTKKQGPLSINVEFEEEEQEGGTTSGESTIWKNSIQASMCVYPKGTFWNQETVLTEDGGVYKLVPSFVSYLQEEGTDHESMLGQLRKLSAKFAYVIDIILKNPNEKMFVYSSVVTGAGALLFGAILDVFGFSHAPIPGKNRPISIDSLERSKNRYITLTGSTTTDSQNDILINGIFNKKENMYGDYIRVIIGSHVIGEGVSFFHIRRMFVMTPFWNNGTTEQAIARAIRFKSHDDLPINKRDVTVYRMASDFIHEIEEDIQSIDMVMYKTSEDKDIKIKAIERLMKESAVDCALNYKRNVLANDQPFTQQCDYLEKCDYKCDYIDEDYMDEWVGERIVDTYNLYYADKEIEEIKEIIREIYLYKFVYDFDEMYKIILSKMRNEVPPIVLARALNEIIIYNMPIKNKLGFQNYVREDRNLFFLVDSPFTSSIFTSWYYAANPEPDVSFSSVSDMLKFWQYEKMGDTIELMIKNQDDADVIMTILDNLPSYIRGNIVETFLLARYKNSDKNKKLQNIIFDKYKDSILELEGQIYLTANKDEVKKLEMIEDELDWVLATDEEMLAIETIKVEKKKELKNVGWGYFAYIQDKYSGDQDYKNLKIAVVKEQREKQKGGKDKRQEREGLTCGTGDMSLAGLAVLYYNLLKVGRETGKEIPDMKLYDSSGRVLRVTKQSLLNNDKFIKYLSDKILNDALDQVIIDTMLEKEQMEFGYLESVKEKFLEIFKQVKDKTEKTELGNVIEAYQEKPKPKKGELVIEEDREFTNEVAEEFIRASKITKRDIFEWIVEEDMDMYISLKLSNVVEETVEALTQEEVENLYGFFAKGVNAAMICHKLKRWFEENNLYIKVLNKN